MVDTQNLRWADPETAARFPGACGTSEVLQWNGHALTIQLPSLKRGDLLIPSFAVKQREPYRFQFSLNGVALPTVPSQPVAGASKPPPDAVLATHLDWYEARANVSQPLLTLAIRRELLEQPHLLSVSQRPLELSLAEDSSGSAAVNEAPPGLSQYQAPADIRGRICSPTAVSMVLLHHGVQVDWLQLVAQCKDPASGMYGLWPLCIMRAAQQGALGAVQSFSGWHEVTPFLTAGVPVVASIRYRQNQLPGSPMASTAGHLVVVFGVDERWVLVNDPAAPEHNAVTLRYPRAEFSKAWFEHRGAGYVLLP